MISFAADPASAETDAADTAPPRTQGDTLRLLTFSTLYPNAVRPHHGVFVENRLRHLVATGQASSTVIAPVPWFPKILGSLPAVPEAWRQSAGVPACTQRHGLVVHHPRYLAIPRLGMSAAPALLAAGALAAARRASRGVHLEDRAARGIHIESRAARGVHIEDRAARGVHIESRAARGAGRVDLIDAHYLYPDGVAAIWLGARLGLPVVITARGSDVTQWPDYARPRAMIRWAIRRAAALIAVSHALGERLVALGADPARVTVLRNGVDLALFRPPAERAHGAGRHLLSVGHLIARKGHDRVIAALPLLPDDVSLLIAGEGPERGALLRLAESLGVAGRVRLLGAVPHEALPALYGAADMLVLASSREGWANVLLEAAACGTPVVASPIPGNDEVVATGIGRLAPENTPAGLASAIAGLLAAPPDRGAIRRAAEASSWEATSLGQLAVFRDVLRRPA